MDSNDMTLLERRARARYEWARVRRALFGFAPLLVVVGIVSAISHRPWPPVAFGLGAFVAGAAMLWYGQGPKRAVLPGVAAGLVPMLLALCATFGHVCMGESCMSFCVSACVVGGVVAGLAVAGIGNQRRAGAGFWISASVIAILIGAMGCSCIGYSGVTGLAIGYAAGMVPGLLRRAFGRQPSGS